MADDTGNDVMTDGSSDPDDEADAEGDDTVPSVDLSAYQLSVSVTGRSDDDLGDVEETARRLMDYLVEQSERLEERREGRGVS